MAGSTDDQSIPKPLDVKAAELRASLQDSDPQAVAARTASLYRVVDAETGEFRLRYWGAPIIVTYPAFIVRDSASGVPLNALDQAMVLYHFRDSDGAPVTGQWMAFSDLPNGSFYAQAFQGYTGQELARAFGDDVEALAAAAQAIGGQRLAFADVAYRFQALPRIPLMLACWLGDEDFPSSYRILFDSSAPHHLITDGCAILGSLLTGKLKRTKGSG